MMTPILAAQIHLASIIFLRRCFGTFGRCTAGRAAGFHLGEGVMPYRIGWEDGGGLSPLNCRATSAVGSGPGIEKAFSRARLLRPTDGGSDSTSRGSGPEPAGLGAPNGKAAEASSSGSLLRVAPFYQRGQPF